MSENPKTLGQLVGAYVTEQCTVLVDAEAGLRNGENLIHPTRVAVRRLRSTIRVYSDLFDVARTGRLEEELVWWAGLLGAVRDLDVLGSRLEGLLADLPPELVLGPVQRTVQTELGVRRKEAFDVVQQTLDTDRYRALVGLAEQWRSDPPLTEAAAKPAAAVTGYVKRAKKKVEKRLAASVGAAKAGEPFAELLHGARKAGKRHRYAVEAAAPALGAKAEKVIDERKALQDVLGEHHDAVVSAEFLRGLGARLGVRSGQNGFTYGLLYAREQALGDRLLTDLKPFS